MTVTASLIVVLALGCVALGLVAYHLLERLERLERAVQGGLGVPSHRLTREQFEYRFHIALARSRFAAEIDHGLVLFAGPELDGSELASTLEHLARPDRVSIAVMRRAFVPAAIASRFEVLTLDEQQLADLGVATTPFAMVIDDRSVRAAEPLVSAAELITLAQQYA